MTNIRKGRTDGAPGLAPATGLQESLPMPTPMFKVLAQSLRLGQPPDATTAVRVLVEVLEKQHAEIEDLRSKLSIAASRLQYAEGRLARLIEQAEQGPGALESAPQQQQQQHATPAPPPPRHRSAPPRAPEPTRPSQRPPAIPNAPPIPKAPRVPTIPPASAPASAPATPAAAAADWYAVPPEMPSITDGFDEFNQTLVIHKRDVQQRAEAPFPLAPASERPRAQTAQAQAAQGTPFQPRASEPPPPPPPRVSDPSTHAMDDGFHVSLPDDDGEGSTVTDRVAREALEGFAELESRRPRGGRGEG